MKPKSSQEARATLRARGKYAELGTYNHLTTHLHAARHLCAVRDMWIELSQMDTNFDLSEAERECRQHLKLYAEQSNPPRWTFTPDSLIEDGIEWLNIDDIFDDANVCALALHTHIFFYDPASQEEATQ